MASLVCERASMMRAQHTTTQSEKGVNVLLTSFAGLGLPRTLALPFSPSTTIGQALDVIYSRLPCRHDSLVVTTTSNKQLLHTNDAPLSTLLPNTEDTLLPLRLSARICGGKGGFGSQLRAAGGRMSSRKKRNQQDQNPNGSNRNLDGRRLRTVDSAKRLAEYLATKPEMEKKEKEEQKKRLQSIVDAAERKEEEIKSGKMASGQGRLNADYVESKEMAEERTREAVLRAMSENVVVEERTGSESSADADGDNSLDEVDERSSSSSRDSGGRGGDEGRITFFGWDEDDEDEDVDDGKEGVSRGEDDRSELPPATQALPYDGKGKGKGRA